MAKYVFVFGGVVSGLGKGIVAASLGRLLKLRGYKVQAQKFDPYLNIDPGTMNPTQHGEVFVTADGAETDLDLGHYERFIDENLTKYCNLTSGKALWRVLNNEREGKYLGKTVQIIPHVTNEIKDFISRNVKETKADVMITEIGGTVGDIEGQPFIEAIRQFMIEVGRENCVVIHVCLTPYISGSDEYKSKPVQHSVKELQSMGIAPDIVVTRSATDCGQEIRDKIAMFASIRRDCVISNTDVDCLYAAPVMLHENGLDKAVCRILGLKDECDLSEWNDMLARVRARDGKLKIAIVGKYVSLHDSYISIIEALQHASYTVGKNLDMLWVDSEKITAENVCKKLKDVDGVLVPGGFGERGIDGMIEAARYTRENKIPYFGICLGMQIAVIEYARDVAGIADACSGEFKEGSKVIDLMPDQKGLRLGGTMRLGAYPCIVKKDTRLYSAYGKEKISERHRHRYEFNNDYRETLENAGLVLAGTSPDGVIVEAVETKGDGYFVGVQFHPEFTSRPNRAGALFVSFLTAADNYSKEHGDIQK